jgi:hypothetical protein
MSRIQNIFDACRVILVSYKTVWIEYEMSHFEQIPDTGQVEEIIGFEFNYDIAFHRYGNEGIKIMCLSK